MELDEIQENFVNYIQNKNTDVDIDFTNIFDEAGIDIKHRMSIYKGHYYKSLTDILINTYPAVTKIVGNEFMTIMCKDYLHGNPPKQACLNLFGDNFPEFIKTYNGTEELYYLYDIARYEELINSSYYSEDEDSFEFKDLDEDINLEMKQSSKLISSKYPINEIRDFAINDDKINPQGFCMKLGETNILITRQNSEVNSYLLEDSDWKLLKLLNKNKTLETSLSCVTLDDKDFDFASFLQKFISIETFSSKPTNK